MIRAVVFDFGGVLMRTADYAGRRKWEERLGLGKWGADRLIFNSEVSRRAQLGQCTEAEVWRTVAEQYGLDDAALAEFKRDFWSGDFLDSELLDLIRRLRGGYIVGLLSNAWDSLRRVLARDDFGPLAPLFDVIVISCEEGLMKPDPDLYRLLVARLGTAPEEVVFVDDVQENVDGARAVGLHAIRFRSTPAVEAALRELGVETGP